MSRRLSSIPPYLMGSHGLNAWSLLLTGVCLFFLVGCDSGPNARPTADFSYEPKNPRAGTEVTFTSKGNDPEGNIQELIWHIPEVGDYVGVDSARGRSFTNVFPTKGTYTVEHTVRDQISLFDTATKTINVRLRYSQTSLHQTEIIRIPTDTEDGENWTRDGDPILYFTISGPGEQMFESNHVNFNKPPVTFDVPNLTFTDLQASYTLSLWDEDNSSSDDDDLIREIDFSFKENIDCRIAQVICYPSVDDDNETEDDDVKRLLHFPPDVNTSNVDNADVIVYLSLNWSNP